MINLAQRSQTSLNKAIIELIRRDKKFCGQKDALGKENANLKALFENHNLPWPTENGFSTVTGFDVPNAESTLHSKLPPELQHRILGFILQLSKPIIDAGVKILKCNVTESEHAEQQYIPVQFLRVSKAFNDEGTQSSFRNNEYLFTRVSS
ncbi:hypothetical protein MFRU_025g00410 [Monilinia fructicola]|nr:hypothetical protein MFRU_025g00410 [Monilinia fructicola]